MLKSRVSWSTSTRLSESGHARVTAGLGSMGCMVTSWVGQGEGFGGAEFGEELCDGTDGEEVKVAMFEHLKSSSSRVYPRVVHP